MDEKFLKPYNPKETEDKIYKKWEDSGYFNPDNLPKENKDPFCIVLPPPNVTGTLHMGHAAMLAIEDIMIRYNRMLGKKTLWLPGTDHAAIATQSKVEGIIYKEEGKRRHDLGREELLKRVNKYAEESHDTIVNQVKKMGASIDWSREAFTLDQKRNFAVNTAFKKMYDDGLIYRKNKVINWDPKGQTVISDDEVVYEETESTLYTFKYSDDFPIPIATTRPETKVGDVAVAVNPEDKRYASFIGKTFDIIFCQVPLKIKIIGDEKVDMEYGTGAVGVTPAHSMVDWQMAEKNNLPVAPVINEFAKMIVPGSELDGKKTTEARVIIVDWLKSKNLLIKEEKIKNNISKAERTGGIIEPLPKLQWFIDVNKEFTRDGKKTTLKELMRDAVSSKKIKILPERFEKIYFHWIDNLHDWCISRQIWYGHRIPVWYKEGNNKELFCGVEGPRESGWIQDEDTLDTWFSSGLWTFSTLGWPEAWDPKTGKAKPGSDLAMYHPTSVLETGYDILFFWVARMILMSTYLIDQIPFETVYLHGLVRDSKGVKMSKSLGNIIDPLDLINKYSADATRLSLIIGTGPGNDMNLQEDKVRGYKNFGNKIWNIARFIFSNTEDEIFDKDFKNWSDEDKKLNQELDSLIKEITKEMNEYKFYLVGEKVYHYVWHRLADVLIEESKKVIVDEKNGKSRKQFLLHTLRKILIILHPFIPFITEEIWGSSPFNKDNSLLIIENWPTVL